MMTATAWYYKNGSLTGILSFEGTKEHILWEVEFAKVSKAEKATIIWE